MGLFYRRRKMSWFKRRPTIKEHIQRKPQYTSPASNKMLEKAKESRPQNTKQQTTPDK